MFGFRGRMPVLAVGAPMAGAAIAGVAIAGAAIAWPAATSAAASTSSPGGPLSRSNNTPFAPSKAILGARWTSRRYDPPGNQSGDILPTVWSDDGGTYVLMDDGGVDVPLQGGLWRQSLARVTGMPPKLRFQHVGDAATPSPRTWSQINGNPDNDDGPLGPYYSIGFAEAGGVFYATQQRNWNWAANGPYTGLVGIAYSRDHGSTWHTVDRSFPAPLRSAVPVLRWGSHITYPEMTYDAPLHRYLLTFTYSYSSRPPSVWTGGAELVVLEAPSPAGPFSFVARSSEFGPSNGYGAGFPSQWISSNGRDLWLKWAANFDGCKPGLDCSGKYGFNAEARSPGTGSSPGTPRDPRSRRAGSPAPAP